MNNHVACKQGNQPCFRLQFTHDLIVFSYKNYH